MRRPYGEGSAWRVLFNMSDFATPPSLRLDRWLWAARAYKSRSQAATACDGGKISVNGTSAKPHKLIRPGDEVAFGTPIGKRIWKVVEIGARRGPANVARGLYEDLTPLAAPPDRSSPQRECGGGRPTKRERRRMKRFIGQP